MINSLLFTHLTTLVSPCTRLSKYKVLRWTRWMLTTQLCLPSHHVLRYHCIEVIVGTLKLQEIQTIFPCSILKDDPKSWQRIWLGAIWNVPSLFLVRCTEIPMEQQLHTVLRVLMVHGCFVGFNYWHVSKHCQWGDGRDAECLSMEWSTKTSFK